MELFSDEQKKGEIVSPMEILSLHSKVLQQMGYGSSEQGDQMR
jgi:hypothetical protein